MTNTGACIMFAVANQTLRKNFVTMVFLSSSSCPVFTQWYNIPEQQSRDPGRHW